MICFITRRFRSFFVDVVGPSFKTLWVGVQREDSLCLTRPTLVLKLTAVQTALGLPTLATQKARYNHIKYVFVVHAVLRAKANLFQG